MTLIKLQSSPPQPNAVKNLTNMPKVKKKKDIQGTMKRKENAIHLKIPNPRKFHRSKESANKSQNS